MNISKLSHKHLPNLKQIIDITLKNIQNADWFIPLDPGNIDNIFDINICEIYGVFDNDELLAISGLFWDESDYADIKQILNIADKKVAEIAECITLPKARGNNYMLTLNKLLLQKAKEKGYEYVIATAHPDNIASNKSLTKLGMTTNNQFMRYDKYLRNIYRIKI